MPGGGGKELSEAEGGALHKQLFTYYDLRAAFKAGVETSDVQSIEADDEFEQWFLRTAFMRWDSLSGWGKTPN